jgi:glyoxylase-like metal-dependent hydrolase (beta-lactamase superfamily II)
VDNSVRVWNFVDRTLEICRVYPEGPVMVALHPSGLQLLVGFADRLRLLNVLPDDLREVKVAQTIIQQSREVWLAADHSKFHRQAMVELASLRQIDRLFTDAPPPSPFDRLLADGERLAVAGCELLVREIPGHSAGHVVYVMEAEGPPVVFGGDVLFREGIGRTDFPDGDFEALAAGIRRHLYSLPPEAIVFPGHGEPTTVGHERRHNPFVTARSSD